MDSLQLTSILRSNPVTRNAFRGCFPSNRLPHPDSLQYPAALVVNMDPHGQAGSHWVAIYAKGRQREAYYFDSLCLPTHPTIERTFLVAFPSMRRNKRRYQSLSANTCAPHCICFVYHMAQGYSFDQFIRRLETIGSGSPDLYAVSFVHKMLKG